MYRAENQKGLGCGRFASRLQLITDQGVHVKRTPRPRNRTTIKAQGEQFPTLTQEWEQLTFSITGVKKPNDRWPLG